MVLKQENHIGINQSFGAAPATAPGEDSADSTTYVQKRKTKHKHTYIQTIHTNKATTRINQ